MNPRITLTRALACGVLGLTALSTACVDQVPSGVATGAVTTASLTLLPERSLNSPSDAQLARLAKCESGGNPSARSKSGTYTGLYQFDRGTWNSVARQVMPQYVGVVPGNAPAAVQDAMARKLYSQRGRRPWPVCGRNL